MKFWRHIRCFANSDLKMQEFSKKQMTVAICLALAAGTIALYSPIVGHDFLNYDDDAYITQNPHVTSGLSWINIVWAFTSGYAANWHPLTWISHMMDCQFFGLNPAGHHLVNLLFHAANTALLFILLNYMTGATWRSAFVAALFAWHPLHVESVAWAAERKDVLSAFFWMLTLLCYARFTQSRVHSPESTVRSTPSSPLFYVLALLFFACGLMSKPMVVTLPFVLLLLDFWPLRRVEGTKGTPRTQALARLAVEKIPFFALSLIGSVITYLAQKTGGAVVNRPFPFRISNALWAYERYISKIFWPSDLSIVYPFPGHGLLLTAIQSAILLMLCSILFIFLSRRWPYLFVGWFWFLGMLVPVIGIVQIGSASMADRYTYLPAIGLFIAITWGFADLFERPRTKPVLIAATGGSLVACLWLTSIQIMYWRNSITLFRHALAVTMDNFVACSCLGQALDSAGDEKDAMVYCNEAVRINPDYPAGQFFLAQALWKSGDQAQALSHINAATRASAHDSNFQYILGKFLFEHGKADDAITRFTAALDIDPGFAEAHNALGKVYLQQGQLQKATDELSQAVRLEPDNAQFHYDLGTVLLRGSQPTQAITEFTEAVRLQPDFPVAHENLAVALANQGDMADAIEHFARAADLQPNDPETHFNLGFAYLNTHQAAQAAEQFQDEVRLSPNEPKAHYRLAQALQEQNELSQAVSEYRQTLRLSPSFADAKKELDEILAAHPDLR
jgi:protein O-mannosyl-transferase